MSQHWNHMPKPEPIWIALGIVVAAIAAALGAKRRRVFFAALRELVHQHESRERVVSFTAARSQTRAMSQAIRGGAAWLSRLIEELDDGAEQ